MIAQILLADDNADFLSVLSDYLVARGHHVVTAKDGFQLSQMAADCRPHLIITDVQMPGAYGSSAYQVLQKDADTSQIPVIFISGHPYDKIAPILPTSPRTRFLQKPLDYEKLELLMDELLPLGGFCP